MPRKPKREYVVYKGDEVVCGGTAKEIMEKLNITNGTFRRMASGLSKREESPQFEKLIAESVSVAELEKELGVVLY
ncbi:hypothetical protein QI302_02335 [Staphylococcus saprophyticus]|uniref:hypothetical protein n=1 Tax=Staphylococcus saprophyticus TaxID=29385 RepID=UPI00119F76C9|nr:hypothetical protein [Staphylococcus saprophyticus]MDW3926458.1 hypothetical protein [Staphylococcus saprophyticus]MDW4104095.1 hypothetical protein [Staphylococcus saprophyticus]MDW4205181.1 hypothetical protein [Staphylococcus saprophyticus]MDW4219846.1 hypothetical protein [Staphylococcus saprophyticus]MDW4338254.1 hypothetical protein [Staphylococcus saprophyticus]